MFSFGFHFKNIYRHNIGLPIKQIRCCFWYCFDLALSCQTISLPSQKPGPISRKAKGSILTVIVCPFFSSSMCTVQQEHSDYSTICLNQDEYEKTWTEFQMYSHHPVSCWLMFSISCKSKAVLSSSYVSYEMRMTIVCICCTLTFSPPSALPSSESCLTVQYLSLSVSVFFFDLCFCQSILQEHN